MPNKYEEIVRAIGGRYSDDAQFGPVLDEQHFQKIEAHLKTSLPSDYREFLRDYGGIYFDYVFFPYHKDGVVIEENLAGFNGSTEDETIADNYYQFIENFEINSQSSPEDFEWYPGIHLVRDAPRPVRVMKWPEELLPIAYDYVLNPICIALFGLRPGSIFYFIGNPTKGDENLYLIANSFDDFISLLRKDE
jgi:hypothetical protein